jgi:hypothetical protein
MNRKQYLEYVEHFNKKEFDKVAGYFTPDITVEYPDNFAGPEITPRTLHGPKEFIDNYVSLTSNVKEVLEVTEFLSEGKQLFVELYTEFHTFRDVPAGAAGLGRKKGDITIMNNWVLYDLDKKGKMKRIRIAHFRNADPKTAKYK